MCTVTVVSEKHENTLVSFIIYLRWLCSTVLLLLKLNEVRINIHGTSRPQDFWKIYEPFQYLLWVEIRA